MIEWVLMIMMVVYGLKIAEKVTLDLDLDLI